MSRAHRSGLWLAALAFACVSGGVALLLWRDGHIEYAREEVVAVLVPAGLAAVFALLASKTFDDVTRAAVDAVKAWRGTKE